MTPVMRTGRLLNHDPRSLNFPVRTEGVTLKSRTWRRYGSVLDQGNLGSCTGNSGAQGLNHLPVRKTGKIFKEPDALRFYSRGTQIDPFQGSYPPEDTGSSGLAVAKAIVEEGHVTRYEHAFGLEHGLEALMLGPLMIGTLWYEDMFWPNAEGVVEATGDEAGGHEYLWIGVDLRARMGIFLNSWSDLWGVKGRFYMSFETIDTLLKRQGDLIRLAV